MILAAEVNNWARFYICKTDNIETIPAISCKYKNSNELGTKKPIITIAMRWVNKASLVSKKALRIMGNKQKGMRYKSFVEIANVNEAIRTIKSIIDNKNVTLLLSAKIFALNCCKKR